MNCNEVKDGLRVKITKLGETRGMLINPRHLDVRAEGKKGVVSGYVAGHGGDVWWVRHDSGSVGAYMFTEFEPEEDVATPNI
jgi:hypothetical protein